MDNLNDKELRQEAKKRIDFKHHFLIYIFFIALIWITWAISGYGYVWPIWPTIGWGLGIMFHYTAVYHPFSLFSIEKEIEKLKREKGKIQS